MGRHLSPSMVMIDVDVEEADAQANQPTNQDRALSVTKRTIPQEVGR